MSYFDNWLSVYSRRNVGFEVVNKFYKDDVWKMPWSGELIEKIENNGDIEEVIKAKNQKFYEAFAIEEIYPREDRKSQCQEEKARLEELSSRSRSFNQKLDAFEKDVEILISKYPPERQVYVKGLLKTYFQGGYFVEQDGTGEFQQLRQPPQGFFNKIRQGSKIKEANQYLDAFIDKYQTENLRTELNGISKTFSDWNLFSLGVKFESIVNQDKKEILSSSEDFAKEETIRQEQMVEKQNEIQKIEAKIEAYKDSFKKSEILREEEDVIRTFAEEIRKDIQHPKQYKVSDYIECLENMSDDKEVMFNLRLAKDDRNRKAVEQVLKYNGLQVGDDMDQWLLRKETRGNSDEGMQELFSPVMSAKEAKQIMPKLKADLESAKLTSGVVVPLSAEDVFKDVNKQTLAQDVVEDKLQKLMVMAQWQLKRKDPNIFYGEEQEKKVKQYLGVSSFDELSPVYGSLDELKQQFPKDKYLFSGTMASDDYCQLSGRIGRNGMVYATPDISYAEKYDGVVNLGSSIGLSATGDRYVSTEVGKYKGEKVYIGFINVYEQSPDDKFFDNFGMEEYHCLAGDEYNIPKKSYDLWEPSPNGAVILGRQGQNAVNHRLTKEQAINGFVEKGGEYEIGGKIYRRPRYDSETYVTPEKNPLKAKIMHISYKNPHGGTNTLYLSVPDNPDEFIKYILNSRQADMADTFNAALKEDVLARFQKQKEEFGQGIVRQVRSPDFWEKKQAKLQSVGKEKEKKSVEMAETKTDKISQKTENLAEEKIRQLRGVKNSKVQEIVVEGGEKLAEKTSVRAGVEAVKSSEGLLSKISKADNAVNQVIDKTIDKGSELLNNNVVGRVYEKASEKVADTKVVKAVEKTTAKVTEKAAQTAVGKAVVKTVAKTAGSAVGKSLLKKIPLVSLGAGAYFAWDRLKEGDWKAACGEVASGALGCFPGVGTAASAAIDVGLAAKDIKTVVDENKVTEVSTQIEESESKFSDIKTKEDREKIREIILQKQGKRLPETQAKVQTIRQNDNFHFQEKIAQQGRE